jgi:DNA-binding CsgD family transcriptional regulator
MKPKGPVELNRTLQILSKRRARAEFKLAQIRHEINVELRRIKETVLPDNDLTPREKEVVELIKQHKVNKEIATILHISIGMAKAHKRKIFEKLGITSQMDLM